LSMLNRAYTTGPAPALVPGIRRPMVFLCADEDPVTHSQDWLRAFAGTNGHEQPYNARRTFTEGGHSWNVDVVVMGKACHGGEQGALAEGFAFPGETTFTKDL